MVRFKVIKGSQLLLSIAIVLLVLVVGGIAVKLIFFTDSSESVNTQANLVQVQQAAQQEAETDTVFASSHIEQNALALDPGDEEGVDIEILSTPAPTSDMPSVLIYHTHTHEAYEQIAGDQYDAIEAWRTTDHDHSVVRVGTELANLLRAKGFEVIHDTTDHEQDDLKTAYTRSLATLESYERTFDLYIDLHRDAYIDGMDKALYDDGQSLAQLMVLIGNGVGFRIQPHYEENLAFAEALTQRVNLLKPGLCKDVLVKDGRYNQNIGVFSILIEVGHNKNTLREALSALPYLADGIESLMILQPEAELTEMQKRYSEASD